MSNANRVRRLLAYGVVVSVVLPVLIACGDTGDGANTPPAVITAQPTDQSVTAGSTATFSVTARNATGYQWQRSTDGGASSRPQLSGDGRYVLFASRATNLRVDPNADTLLVRDRQAGTTRVASRRIDGTPASGGIGTGSEALSRDGSTVVFTGELWKITHSTSFDRQIFRVGRP